MPPPTTDGGLVAALATRVAGALREAAPGLQVVTIPDYATLEIRDGPNRLTFVASTQDPGGGDRRLSVWVMPPKDRPMDHLRGLRSTSFITLDDVADREREAADWIVRAVLSVRAASLDSLTAARARREAEKSAAERARIEAQAVAQARARKEAEVWAAAEAVERARAEERARKEAEIRAAAEALRLSRKTALLQRLQIALATDYLGVDDVVAADPSRDLIRRPELDDLKVAFVRNWAARDLADQLDADQAAAVAAFGHDVKVIARAGSGKTRTLTTRAIFLQKHCRVSPHDLLLLAFNHSAAEEMKKRLGGAVGEDLPHVMTFHALAHALVHPDEDMVYDDRRSGQLGLSREIQEVIDDHIRSRDFRDRIRDLMLAHFREDWERIVDGQIELTIDEFLAYRRALQRETLKGDFVKSLGEREIANALFENNVPYAYERAHPWGASSYRPDFTIAPSHSGGVVIEYFGLEGDPDYDEQSSGKRAYWARRGGWTLLEYSPRDLTSHGLAGFRQVLLADLRALGIRTRARSEEEIWQEVRQRAVDRFTETMTAFVGRCRKRNLSPEALGTMIATHEPSSDAERLFLEVGQSVFAGYLRRLEAVGKEDFDGLMWRAVESVRGGQSHFVRDRGREHGDLARLRYVLVDEFQDFSEMFYELLSGIKMASPGAEFFCVGDDWQAINGFAGADLRYFTDFPTYFGDPVERGITTNYRSAEAVVRVGNAVMEGRGEPARSRPGAAAGRVWICPLDKFQPSAFEDERHNGDVTSPAVLRLVRRFLDEGLSVVLLSRRNQASGYIHYDGATIGNALGLDRFIAHVRSFLPEEDRDRVHASTTHRYKGLEQPAVIVLDAVEGAYPLIHPSWVFRRVLGDSLARIESEERRLFYVAVTRAQESLALITESTRESPYLDDIRRSAPFEILDWAKLPEVVSLDAARLEIRVYEAYNVRDQLKDLKYRWNQAGLYWFKTVPQAGFSFETLLVQRWAGECGRIVVRSLAGDMVHERFGGPEPVRADADRRAAEMLARLKALE